MVASRTCLDAAVWPASNGVTWITPTIPISTLDKSAACFCRRTRRNKMRVRLLTLPIAASLTDACINEVLGVDAWGKCYRMKNGSK